MGRAVLHEEQYDQIGVLMVTHRVMDTIDVDRIINLELREMDQIEVMSATGLPVHDAVRHSIEASSMVFIIEKNGKPEGVWGYVTQDDFLIPWFLCTDELFTDRRDRVLFGRGSRKAIEKLSKQVPMMFNFVYVHNTEAIAWLEWLGFAVDYDSYYTFHDDTPFYMFTKGINLCAHPQRH